MTNYKVQIIIVTTQDKMRFGHPQLCFCCFFCKSPISTIFSPKVVFGSFWSILCVTPSLQTCLATTFYGYMYKKKTQEIKYDHL